MTGFALAPSAAFAADDTGSLASLRIGAATTDDMLAGPNSPDTSTTNGIVPSAGTVVWPVQFTSASAGTVTLTATLDAGSGFNAASVIAACQSADGGTGVGSVNAAGTVATCVLTVASSGSGTWAVSAKIVGGNNTTQRLHVAGGGVAQADSAPVTVVTGNTNWDVQVGSYANQYTGGNYVLTVGAGLSTELNEANGLKGLDPIGPSASNSSFSFQIAVTGSLPLANATISNCNYSLPGFPARSGTANNAVTNSGTWSCSLDRSAGIITVNVTGADTSLNHYPTQTASGVAIASNTAWAIAGGVQLSIPGADFAANQNFPFQFQIKGVDPTSVSGTSNYGTPSSPLGGSTTGYAVGQEPGAAYKVNVNGVAGNISTTVGSGISLGYQQWHTDTGAWPPGWATPNGSGPQYAGQTLRNYWWVTNTSPNPVTQAQLAYVFDPTQQQIVGNASGYGSFALAGAEYGFVPQGTPAEMLAAVGKYGDGNASFYPTLAAAQAAAAGAGTVVNAARVKLSTAIPADQPVGYVLTQWVPGYSAPAGTRQVWGASMFSPQVGAAGVSRTSTTVGSGPFFAPAQLQTSMDLSGPTVAGVTPATTIVQPAESHTVTITSKVSQPNLPAGAAASATNVTQTVTIPASLQYTAGSAKIDGTPVSPLSDSTDATTGTRTLVFQIGPGGTLDQSMAPALTLNVVGSASVALGASGTITAVIDSSPSLSQPLSTRTVTAPYVVIAPSMFSWNLAQSHAVLTVGESQNYTIAEFNTSSSAVTGLSGVAVLPYNGAAGTTGLSGPVSLTALSLSSTVRSADAHLFTTTAAPATVDAAVAGNPANPMGGGITWTEYTGGAIPAGSTAIAWAKDTLAGADSGSGETLRISLTVGGIDIPSGTGKVGMQIAGLAWTQAGAPTYTTTPSSQVVADYSTVTVSGTVYKDNDFSGALNSADSGVGGATVTLAGHSFGADGSDNNGSGDDVAVPSGTTTTTNSSGVYSFTNLAAGKYTASAQAPGGFAANVHRDGRGRADGDRHRGGAGDCSTGRRLDHDRARGEPDRWSRRRRARPFRYHDGCWRRPAHGDDLGRARQRHCDRRHGRGGCLDL